MSGWAGGSPEVTDGATTGDIAMADPFTIDLRLCDDDGWVSDASVDDPSCPTTLDATYLERHNRLANQNGDVNRGGKPVVAEQFRCTGSAHLAATTSAASAPPTSASCVRCRQRRTLRSWSVPATARSTRRRRSSSRTPTRGLASNERTGHAPRPHSTSWSGRRTWRGTPPRSSPTSSCGCATAGRLCSVTSLQPEGLS